MFDWRAIRSCAGDLACEERADDQLGAVLDRTLRGCARAVRRALGVLRHERNRRIVEIEQRKLGSLLQRLGDGGRVARAGERQKQRDLHRAGRCRHAGRDRPRATAAAASYKQHRNGETCERELRSPDGQIDALWKWHEPLRFKTSLDARAPRQLFVRLSGWRNTLVHRRPILAGRARGQKISAATMAHSWWARCMTIACHVPQDSAAPAFTLGSSPRAPLTL